ncbi:hypothetical protein RSAG8_11913, partial [Rhizoctonia solani AG-8 WAC10335]
MDHIKTRLASLRKEADDSAERAEKAEAKVKDLEQQLLQREQEVKSLGHKLENAEQEVEKLEGQLSVAKKAGEDGVQSQQSEGMLKSKIELLEGELDKSEASVKETMEKLRQVDIKAEHFERQVQKLEQERVLSTSLHRKNYYTLILNKVNLIVRPPSPIDCSSVASTATWWTIAYIYAPLDGCIQSLPRLSTKISLVGISRVLTYLIVTGGSTGP